MSWSTGTHAENPAGITSNTQLWCFFWGVQASRFGGLRLYRGGSGLGLGLSVAGVRYSGPLARVVSGVPIGPEVVPFWDYLLGFYL